MLPIPASVATYLALFTGGFLALLGLMFTFAPERGLKATKHRAENLTTIMAGRYFFMVFIAVGVVVSGTREQLGYVFLGLAGVAFFDAFTYYSTKSPVSSHLLAGLAALGVAFIALGGTV